MSQDNNNHAGSGSEDFATDLEPDDTKDDAPPERRGPPDDWEGLTWFDYRRNEWWFLDKEWRLDPPPIRPLGFKQGEYSFVTAAGEVRPFKSAALQGRGGLADLFAGDLRWPTRHYPATDKDGNKINRPNPATCTEGLIRVCTARGFLDESLQHRSVGTWRGDDGAPLVHAGNVVFAEGDSFDPGAQFGDFIYVIAGRREPPAHKATAYGLEWQPATAIEGLWVLSALDRWHWINEEARQLCAGGLFCDFLGDATLWKPHKFVLAPPEAGKSTLLRFFKALLGASAGPLLKTYSKAFIERKYSGMALAVLLDEAESDVDADRIKHLFELIRLLSDDGAEGGRAAEGGKTRDFNVHGPVTMAATVRERWRPQDRRRITLLELLPLRERDDGILATGAEIAADRKRAAELSARLRARAIHRWPQFVENLAAAQKAIIDLGGTPGDADQIGHLIAGWWTLTRDDPPDEDCIADVKRFKDYMRTLADADGGEGDEASECFNYLLGSDLHGAWRGGKILTIGQTIARAREKDSVDAGDARTELHRKGLRLIPLEKGDPWDRAWLAIANKHSGLEDVFAKRPEWSGEKWNQIMQGLVGARRLHREEAPIRFAGPPSRALLVPPVYLPQLSDEQP
jgi:hypothetical protein